MPSSPSSIPPLQRPRGEINNNRNRRTHIHPAIAPILAEIRSNRPDKPSLRRTRELSKRQSSFGTRKNLDQTYPSSQIPRQQGQDSRSAPRQLVRLVPNGEVVALAAPEELVFDEEDEGEGDGPVAQEGDEVADDVRQALPPGDGEYCDRSAGFLRPVRGWWHSPATTIANKNDQMKRGTAWK